MNHYNCIVVFNEEMTHLLFCKRRKDPYKGLYNFVGGKVEAGEDSISAAYRELYEETGITHKDICLHRLMDLTYYYQNFILELFVGKISGEVQLVEEVNPLLWLPLTENFADINRFAGEQNIAHIVHVALKAPIDKELLDMNCNLDCSSMCIGVDGCKNGWIFAIILNGELKIEKATTVEELVSKYPEFNELFIDMVIGLPSNPAHVRPDTAARKLIPGRTSTIFAVPCRQAVYAASKEEQIEANERVLGKGLASQTRAIIPKIKEVDEFLGKNKKYRNKLLESHPEVCFAKLNGSVVLSKKSDALGRMERIQILRRFLPMLTEEYVLEKTKEFKCNADDIVDAICLAVTANLKVQGKYEVLPDYPMEDETGLRMQMIIPAEV